MRKGAGTMATAPLVKTRLAKVVHGTPTKAAWRNHAGTIRTMPHAQQTTASSMPGALVTITTNAGTTTTRLTARRTTAAGKVTAMSRDAHRNRQGRAAAVVQHALKVMNAAGKTAGGALISTAGTSIQTPLALASPDAIGIQPITIATKRHAATITSRHVKETVETRDVRETHRILYAQM
jgi:hypothetical protein